VLVEQANKLNNQIFTGEDGVSYNILRLVEWASKNYEIKDISVDRLRHEFKTHWQLSDEPDGSPEFVKRAFESEDYPIVVQKTKAGKLHVMDGRHRAWKAIKTHKRTIKGYIIPINKLPKEAIDFEEQSL
jgi:hypothetical protein